MSTKDITEMFNVSRVTVAEWVNSGKLKALKTLGGHSRIRREDLLGFLTDRRMPIPPELESEEPRILIVDDEPSILKTFPRRIRLRYPAARIDTADNGVDALLKIGQSSPDAIILDLLMPKMDGLEVIYHLKRDPAFTKIKILAISGYVKDEDAIMRAGADAFYRKGDTLDKLLDALPTFLPGLKAAARNA